MLFHATITDPKLVNDMLNLPSDTTVLAKYNIIMAKVGIIRDSFRRVLQIDKKKISKNFTLDFPLSMVLSSQS